MMARLPLDAGQGELPVVTIPKSAAFVPVIVTPLPVMVRAAEVLLVSVKTCGLLDDPTVSEPKFAEEGVRATPEGGVVPVPVSATVCGLLESVSAICSVADSAEVVEGSKVTVIVQLEPAARLAGFGQLLTWPKSDEFVPTIEMMMLPSDVWVLL